MLRRCRLSLLFVAIYVGSGSGFGSGRGPLFQCVVSRTYGRGVGLCVGYKAGMRVIANVVPTVCVGREVRGAFVGRDVGCFEGNSAGLGDGVLRKYSMALPRRSPIIN